MREIRQEVTRKVCETSQGQFAEPPLIAITLWPLLPYWQHGIGWKARHAKLSPTPSTEASSLLSEFIDGVRDGGACAVRVAPIHNKQIVCAVKGQTLCAVRHGAKGRPTVPA